MRPAPLPRTTTSSEERTPMLTPHPTLLRQLVDEYEALVARKEPGEVQGRRDVRAQDLAYTLCVSTGTREVGQALERARHLLAASLDEVAARGTAAAV
ncbi:DUF5133 domain-containing protein [Streptomyces sp. NPDC003333]